MLIVHAFSPFSYVENFYSLPKTCFRIAPGSLNSFATSNESSIPSKQDPANISSCRNHPNVDAILYYLSRAGEVFSLGAASSSSRVLSAPSLKEQATISDHSKQKINVFQNTQSKLLQLSAHIDPIIQFYKKCNNNRVTKGSQLPLELFYFQDLEADPSICKRGVVYVSDAAIWTTEAGDFFFPRSCHFYWGDVRVGLRGLSSLRLQIRPPQQQSLPLPSNSYFFDTVVIDPPWRNKSARRGHKYQMGFSNSDLLGLGDDLKSVMNPRGCLVAVWVTNNNTLKFVTTQLLPSWGVQFVAVWWWLKVRPTGNALFEGKHLPKKTYERVVIGYYGPHVLPMVSSSSPFSSTHMWFSLDDGDPLLSASVTKSSSQTNDGPTEHSGGEATSTSNSKRTYSSMENTSDISTTTAPWMVDVSQFKPLQLTPAFHSHGFFLSSYQTTGAKIEVGASCSDYNDSSELCGGTQNACFDFPVHVIASVPIRHSWKPPLQLLLKSGLKSIHQFYSPPSRSTSFSPPCCEGGATAELMNGDLELFARELRAGCTSIGNEVLLMQTIDNSDVNAGGDDNNGNNCNGFLRCSSSDT